LGALGLDAANCVAYIAIEEGRKMTKTHSVPDPGLWGVWGSQKPDCAVKEVEAWGFWRGEKTCDFLVYPATISDEEIVARVLRQNSGTVFDVRDISINGRTVWTIAGGFVAHDDADIATRVAEVLRSQPPLAWIGTTLVMLAYFVIVAMLLAVGG